MEGRDAIESDQAVMSPRLGSRPFDVALQRFIGLCQVHAVAAGQGRGSLDDCAARLVEALPFPRSCAEFLMLRSVLVEFAARALLASGLDVPGHCSRSCSCRRRTATSPVPFCGVCARPFRNRPRRPPLVRCASIARWP